MEDIQLGTVAMGWTLQAWQGDSNEHPLSPKYLTLPAIRMASEGMRR